MRPVKIRQRLLLMVAVLVFATAVPVYVLASSLVA